MLNEQSYACTCKFAETLEAAVESSAVVFTGKVLRLTSYHYGTVHTVPIERNGEITIGYVTMMVELEVQQTFKGKIKTSVVRVVTTKSEKACGVDFIKGKEYVVFADEVVEAKPRLLFTSLCHMTTGNMNVAKELAVLKQKKLKNN